jgi:hypothetical protein
MEQGRQVKACASSEEPEANMKQGKGNGTVTSLVATLAIVGFAYVLAKNLPDIIRYIKITRM